MEKLIGIILILIGLLALFRFTMSGAWLFLLVAAGLALAVKAGWLGRRGTLPPSSLRSSPSPALPCAP